MTATDEPIIEARALTRTYGSGPMTMHALRDASFDVRPGEMVAVAGRSGSGKTTLLNLLGGLDKPDGGTLRVVGSDVTALDDQELSLLRRERISYVFQTFGLIPALTASENVGVPLRMRRMPVVEREQRVALLLDLVGLRDHGEQRPGQLSGGQQQRVAVARARAGSPRRRRAEEPPGQRDDETGRGVWGLLRAIVDSEGVTAVIATHDPTMMALADRVLTIADGRVEG